MKIEDAVCKNCVFFKLSDEPEWERKNGKNALVRPAFCLFKAPAQYGRPHTDEQDRCGFFTDKATLERPFLFSRDNGLEDEGGVK